MLRTNLLPAHCNSNATIQASAYNNRGLCKPSATGRHTLLTLSPLLQLGEVPERLGRPEKMQYQLVEATAARWALCSTVQHSAVDRCFGMACKPSCPLLPNRGFT